MQRGLPPSYLNLQLTYYHETNYCNDFDGWLCGSCLLGAVEV